MNKTKKVFKATAILLATILYIACLVTVVFPYLSSKIQDKESQSIANQFLINVTPSHQKYSSVTTTEYPNESINVEEIPYLDLLTAMQNYNNNIYLNNQSDLVDAWTYTTSSGFNLSEYGIENEVIGTIDIPKIGTFPIFLGATYEHMGNGMSQLGQTSMPIGGANTNCVIVGHRGWSNGEYLKYIEKVKIGDVITVNNLWYEMKYLVSDIQIIKPNDIERVLIQPGKDLLTIATCHPYGSGGRYRYLLICSRMGDPVLPVTDNITQTEQPQTVPTAQEIVRPIIIEDNISFQSSENEIMLDEGLHILALCLAIIYPIILIVLGIKGIIKVRRKKHKKTG